MRLIFLNKEIENLAENKEQNIRREINLKGLKMSIKRFLSGIILFPILQ